MANNNVTGLGCTPQQFQMIGCLGKHGPYTFYRSIKAGDKIYSLSQFMPVKIWPDSAMLNIADIQLLWSDKSESFCSLKLYFLPENTPDGRLKQHGEDEVITLQEKVIIRAADLLSILVDEKEWDWGYKTPAAASSTPLSTVLSKSFVREQLGTDKRNGSTALSGSSNIVVLSYQRYTRLRAILKRLEGSPEISKWLTNPMVLALGVLNVGPNCRVLYAKESFDHPDLEENELFCNHLAPRFKGRKGRKVRKRNPSHGSLSNESVSSSGGSMGSYKENEHKPINGVKPKLEIDVKQEPQFKSESSRRRGNSNNNHVSYESGSNNIQIMKVEQQKFGGGKRSRTNGLSGVERAVMAKMGEGNNEWDGGTSHLLGPALTELAQKLERSNALQILPIRPSFIGDDDGDNHQVPRKKKKTEYPVTLSPISYHKTGPFESRSLAVGPPGDPRAKKLQEDVTNSGGLTKAHTVSSQVAKMYRANADWKPLVAVGTSPCPYTPLAKICCDPYDAKRQALQRAAEYSTRNMNMDILDFSPKKSRQSSSKISESSSSSRLPSSSSSSSRSVIRNSGNPAELLLDLSRQKSSASSSSKGHAMNDLSIPNAMHQMGVRLTSEVTLFPSKNLPIYPSALDGVMQQNFANPRHTANAALSNSKSTPEIDIQPWKPSGGSGSSGGAGSSRPFPTGIKEQVTAKKHSKGAFERTNHHHHHQAGQGSSKSSSSSSSSGNKDRSHNRDNDKAPSSSSSSAMSAAAAQQQQQQQQQSPYMHPYFGKVDPAYLHFLANANMQLFMPPPPPSYLTIPGAVEQFYKDFFLQAQGIPSHTFPGWFPPGAGNDRGPKS